MEQASIRVLLVEDNPGDARLIQEMLARCTEPRFELERVTNIALGLDRLRNAAVDVMLLDLHLPDSQGLDTVERIHREAPSVPIIVLTVDEDTDIILGAVRHGARDYFVKGRLDATRLCNKLIAEVQRRHELERS